jgi:hypothetical protein
MTVRRASSLVVLAVALLAAGTAVDARPGKPLFYMTTAVKNVDMKATPPSSMARQVGGIASAFNEMVLEGIQHEFKCATTLTTSDLHALLEWDRQRALLGSEASVGPEAFGVSPEYIVSGQIMVVGDDPETAKFFLTATVIKAKGSNYVARASASATLTTVGDVIRQMVQTINEDLAYDEPCPYKGRIKVTIRTKGKLEQDRRSRVYCEDDERKYRFTFKDERSSLTNWNADRKLQRQADVDISYHNSMKRKTDEDDECHRCINGKHGQHVTHDLVTEDDTIKASGQKGVAKLTFSKDGTYTLSLKLDSAIQDGKRTTKRERSEEGTCDVDQTLHETNDRDVSAVLVCDVLKGSGSPLQKLIAAHPARIVTKGHFPDEETTIEAEWDLKRD